MGFLSKIQLEFVEGVLDFLFPKLCLGCKKAGTFACSGCLGQLKASEEVLSFPFLDGVFVCLEPCEFLRSLVHHFKYGFYEAFSQELGSFYRKRFLELGILENYVAVPVPLHWRRFNERGFNQSVLLAQRIEIPLQNILERRRFTQPQAQLNRKQRLENLLQAFAVRKKVPEEILLIDDVCTTGATLVECAKILRKHGVKKIYAMVLSHGL